MEIIQKYFEAFDDTQLGQLALLEELYTDWNQKINVISRKDIDQLYTRHVLHSLAIACAIDFRKGSDILDVGTGGGFPGIPLAILFPDCNFHLIDSIGKKITVVKEIAEAIGLENVKAEQIRAEQVRGKYDFIVSRAVAPAPRIVNWTRQKLKKKEINPLPNGWLFLKGGDLMEELSGYGERVMTEELSRFFEEPFFETKKLIYLSHS